MTVQRRIPHPCRPAWLRGGTHMLREARQHPLVDLFVVAIPAVGDAVLEELPAQGGGTAGGPDHYELSARIARHLAGLGIPSTFRGSTVRYPNALLRSDVASLDGSLLVECGQTAAHKIRFATQWGCALLHVPHQDLSTPHVFGVLYVPQNSMPVRPIDLGYRERRSPTRGDTSAASILCRHAEPFSHERLETLLWLDVDDPAVDVQAQASLRSRGEP